MLSPTFWLMVPDLIITNTRLLTAIKKMHEIRDEIQN